MEARESSLGLLSRLWLREPDSAALAASRVFPSVALHAGEPDAMAAAYADLFLLNVPPYGTAFTDPSGELNGPGAAWAARRYEESGFRPPELFEVGAPDHVGLGLGFRDHLTKGGRKDAEFSSSLLAWVPICCLALEREPSAHPFYRALAAVTRERLLEESTEPSPPVPDESDAAAEEVQEVDLSQVVRFLLAPARSGLFLSRAKLGQLARAAGMRLPFGSRSDVAHLLFQTAGESGKVEAVLDLLGEEVEAWETAYQAWAAECPGWATSSARWLGRTRETRRMLTEMREVLEHPPELEFMNESP